MDDMRSSISLVPFVVAVVASGWLALDSVAASHTVQRQVVTRSIPLEIPRRIDCWTPGPYVPPILVQVDANRVLTYNDGSTDERMTISDLPGRLRRYQHETTGQVPLVSRVVHVDFGAAVRWRTIVETLDKIRGVSTDDDNGEMLVALQTKSEQIAP